MSEKKKLKVRTPLGFHPPREHHGDKQLNSSFGLSLSFPNTHTGTCQWTPHHFPHLQIPHLLSPRHQCDRRSALTWDVPERWRGGVPNRLQKTAENLFFFFPFKLVRSVQQQLFLSDDNSFLSSPNCPHNSKSLTSSDSYPPVAPANSRSDPEQTHKLLYSHGVHLFSRIPAVLFTVKGLDFRPVLTRLRCCSLLPAALFQHGPG